MAGLGVPDHGQVIDIENERGGTLRGAGDAVLRIFEAQELFHVAKANFQRPTRRKIGEDLGWSKFAVGGEEAIVTASMRRIVHDDDAQQFLAGTGIPQSVYGFVPDFDFFAVKTHGGFDPRRLAVLGHLLWTGQTLSFLAPAPATAGMLWWKLIESGLHGHAIE